MPATLNIVEMSGGEYGVALSTRPDGAVTVTPTLPHNSRGVLTLSPRRVDLHPRRLADGADFFGLRVARRRRRHRHGGV